MPRKFSQGRDRRLFAAEPLEPRAMLSAWYVATSGADANPGSLASPFRTVQKAALVARPGDTVYVRAGTYRETVRPARSGTAGASITFRPYNNEVVTISGADVVAGWSQYKNALYKARQGWDLGFGFNQVFVDGRMMNEAHWPNTSLDVSHPNLALSTPPRPSPTPTHYSVPQPSPTLP